MMNSEFTECLPIKNNTAFLKKLDKVCIGNTTLSNCSIHTDNPQGTKRAFFETSITIRMLTRLQNCIIGFYESGAPQIQISLRKGTNLCMTPMPDNTSFYSHKN